MRKNSNSLFINFAILILSIISVIGIALTIYASISNQEMITIIRYAMTTLPLAGLVIYFISLKHRLKKREEAIRQRIHEIAQDADSKNKNEEQLS